MTPLERYDLTNKLVEDIQDLFRQYLRAMDLPATPIFRIKPITDWKETLTVRELVGIVDQEMIKSPRYPKGLKTKCRDRYLVMRRQIVCYIARQMKYPLNFIGDELGIDHATVIHGCKHVADMLQTGDTLMKDTYKDVAILINAYYREKHGKDLPEIEPGGNNA